MLGILLFYGLLFYFHQNSLHNYAPMVGVCAFVITFASDESQPGVIFVL